MTVVEQDYRDLAEVWRLRAFEERVRELHLSGDVVGSVHLDIGQEAVPVGAVSVLGENDAVFATYRGHGYALACGVSPYEMFSELLGRQSGTNGGRGGSAYLTSPGDRFYGENSIVGGGTPIACGAALAGRYDGTNRVALTVVGDGAMNQGSVHEAMNFASAMDLPVIFICVNNGWSELTPIGEMVKDEVLAHRAQSYRMPGDRIDGNDPAQVRDHVQRAYQRAKSGDGPSLIEAMTSRLVGHYIGDMNQYQKPADLDAARLLEPTAKVRGRLIQNGVGVAELDSLERQARDEMANASELALAAPVADSLTAGEHVYV